MALTQVQSGMLNSDSQNYGFKNRIINGACVIDQRNAGGSISAGDGSYALDRWNMYHGSGSGSKGNIQQNQGSVTPPAGFQNYYGFTTTSAYAVGASDAYAIQQRVEGYNISDLAWGTANAQAVTLSFWVRSSLTGTFGGALVNGGANYSYPFSYTINSANTWEYKTITIAGPTGGTWNVTNGVGIYAGFSIGTGSSGSGTAGSWSANRYWSTTGATSVVATLGATFYVTGIQLEKGTVATQFDYRPYGTELTLCQRYNIRYGSPFDTTARFTASGYGGGGTTSGFNLQYPVVMRAAPTVTYSLGTGLSVNNGSAAYAASSLALNLGNTMSAQIAVTQSNSVTGSGISFYSGAADMYINLSAEL